MHAARIQGGVVEKNGGKTSATTLLVKKPKEEGQTHDGASSYSEQDWTISAEESELIPPVQR